MGLIASIYSASSHYRNYTDINYSSFCAITQAINCDTVSQSPWSILLGIPVAWWGIIFFFSMIISFYYGKKKSSPDYWFILLFILSSACLFSIGLGLISILKIQSLCLVCFSVYIITFLLAITCLRIFKNFRQETSEQSSVSTFRSNFSFFTLLVTFLFFSYTGSTLFIPKYWEKEFVLDMADTPYGITEDGHPWIGATDPKITITQFSDYLCFQCAKMNFFLRRLVLSAPDKIRLIHRNYPIDQKVNPIISPAPFHIGSGQLAKIATLAAFRNNFWRTNDYLYSIARQKQFKISIKDISAATGLESEEIAAALTDPTISELLRRDIWRGMKFGITGTPAFIVDGKMYESALPDEILDRLLSLISNTSPHP